jgi:hypothetical protein
MVEKTLLNSTVKITAEKLKKYCVEIAWFIFSKGTVQFLRKSKDIINKIEYMEKKFKVSWFIVCRRHLCIVLSGCDAHHLTLHVGL